MTEPQPRLSRSSALPILVVTGSKDTHVSLDDTRNGVWRASKTFAGIQAPAVATGQIAR